MKNIIILLALCLLPFAGLPTAQAQTKEETMAWIKEKLAEYGAADDKTKVVDITISPCQISWREIWYQDNIQRGSSTYSFNPGDAGMWTFKTDEYGHLIVISESRTIERLLDSGKIYYYSEFYICDGEKNLGINMAKALNYLATFCK